MIWRERFKYAPEMEVDDSLFHQIADIINYKSGYKKGILYTYSNHKTGLDINDFVRNLKTCIVDFKMYKVPRFFKYLNHIPCEKNP